MSEAPAQPPTHTNGGFYYHRHPATACRRRVTPLWSQFPPRAHPQPPATRLQQAQPRAHSRPSHDQAQPPTHANGGFYYHRHPTTACRRRVAALWSQFPPRAHPQPPTTHPQQAQPRPNTTANHAPTHNRQPRPRPCRFRATNLRLPLRTPRGVLPCAAWAPGHPGDISSLSGTRRLSAPLHWCHA